MSAPAPDGARPQVRAIIAAVCEAFGASQADVLSERRGAYAALPRHAAMGLARDLTRHSLPALGRLFDRDHTTVQHGIRRHAERLVSDPHYAARVVRARETLTNRSVEHG